MRDLLNKCLFLYIKKANVPKLTTSVGQEEWTPKHNCKINTVNPVDVIITDLTGKVVFSMKQVSNEVPMNLSSLEKGIYLAKFTSNEGVEQTQKIVLK